MRVWANGDTESCGAGTLPGNTYCIKHRVEALNRLEREIRRSEEDLAEAREAFEELPA